MSQKNPSYLKRFLSVLFTDRDISIVEKTHHAVESEQAVAEIITEDIPDWLTESAKETKENSADELPHSIEEKPFVQMEEAEAPIPETRFPEPETVTIADEKTLPKKSPKNLKEAFQNGGNFWHDESIVVKKEAQAVHPETLPETENTPNTEKKNGNESKEKKKIDNNNPSVANSLLLGLTQDGDNTILLDRESMKRHTLVIGMTGSGKTTMLERMILQDIDAGRGVGLIDPHGDLYDKILRQIPKSRSNDVVLFDLTDIEYPIGFNILENTHEQFSSLIASSIVGVFKKIFGYSWGPRLEYVLRNATLTLLEHPGSTLLDLTLLLTDEGFRNNYLRNLDNPFLKKFWADEFESMSATKQAEVVSPILNKVGQFLSVPLIRNIVSQPQSGFSPRWIMDNKKIFLANLSKGKIGEDVSEMFGSMLVSKFQLDAMSRASMKPEDRSQYMLYVDEFQNFATESFSDIFSEARKYALGLVIAHQYTGQVNPGLMNAILGNVGNIAAFHISSQDAKLLAPNMHTSVSPEELSEQPLYNFVLKTSKDNKKQILRGELLDPDMLQPRTGLQSPEKLQTVVREKFAKKRDFVEGKLTIKMS